MGRTFVRLGFLGLLLAGALTSGATAFEIPVLRTLGLATLAMSTSAWMLGQVMSMRARRQRTRQHV